MELLTCYQSVDMSFGAILRQINVLVKIVSIPEHLDDQYRPFIPSIYEYITYEEDLRESCQVEMITFDILMYSIDGCVDWPRNWMDQVDDI